MICEEYKCALIHIPRTGGSSIEQAFNQPLHKHYTYEDLLVRIQQDYCTFSIVRHPYSRIVSIFSYLKKQHPDLFPLTNYIRDFIDYINLNINKEDSNIKFWLSPQTSWIIRDNKIVVDKVLYFENLQHDFKSLCDHLNVKLSLPHINKSDPIDILDMKSKDILKSIYHGYWEYFI